MEHSAEERSLLLELARRHLESKLLKTEKPAVPDYSMFRETTGLFVTLNMKGALRGCIGYMQGHEPLGDAIFNITESAAFRDPRFNPLEAEELDDVELEISLLSPMEEISDWRNIEIGKHGILLSAMGRQAVFLPQVAPEQGWDLETTLRHLCLKAGLPAKTYLEKHCKFSVFTAEVFSE